MFVLYATTHTSAAVAAGFFNRSCFIHDITTQSTTVTADEQRCCTFDVTQDETVWPSDQTDHICGASRSDQTVQIGLQTGSLHQH